MKSWKGNKHDEKCISVQDWLGALWGFRDRQGVYPGIGLTGADYKHVGRAALNMAIIEGTGRNAENVRHCEMYLRMECGHYNRRSILS
jgi:hypothetical protein